MFSDDKVDVFMTYDNCEYIDLMAFMNRLYMIMMILYAIQVMIIRLSYYDHDDQAYAFIYCSCPFAKISLFFSMSNVTLNNDFNKLKSFMEEMICSKLTNDNGGHVQLQSF